MLLAFLTGRSASPLLPLFVPWLGSAAARVRKPQHVFLPAALLITAVVVADGRGLAGALYGGLLLLAALLVFLPARRQRGDQAQAADADAVQAPTPHLLEHALEGVRNAVAAGRAMLWQVNIDGDEATPWIVRGGLFGKPAILGGDVLGWVARQGIVVRTETRPAWAAADTEACAVAPVGRGVLLSLEFASAGSMPEADVIERSASYLSAFIELQHERNSGLDQRKRLNALMSVLRQLPAEIEPRPLAQRLAEAGLHLTGAAGAAVAEWDGERGRVVALAGSARADVPLHAVFTGSESDTGMAARAGSTIIRAPRNPGGLPVLGAAERVGDAARALAVLPLIVNGTAVATLTLWTQDAALDAAGLDALEALAPYAALQFSHAQAFGLLSERADRDALTGLLNRQAFDAQFAAENARYQRYLRPFALLLIDIDHFKQVNDQHGHPAGDAVLGGVGGVLAAALREVDLAARYGGEEFAILLPETELAAAVEIAERIRRRVAALAVQMGGKTLSVTASVGVSACPECAHDPEALIRTADAALYRSKEEGRNRVTGAARRQRVPG